MGQISDSAIVYDDRVDVYDHSFAGLVKQVVSNFAKGTNGSAFVLPLR